MSEPTSTEQIRQWSFSKALEYDRSDQEGIDDLLEIARKIEEYVRGPQKLTS